MPQYTGHSGEPGGIPVLPVNAESIFPADLIKGIYPFLILFVICGLDADNCVQRFSARMYQCGDWQFQFAVNRPLFIDRYVIRFHQNETIIGDVGVRDAFPVEGIEADPRSCIRFRVADYPSRVCILTPKIISKITQLKFAKTMQAELLLRAVLPKELLVLVLMIQTSPI